MLPLLTSQKVAIPAVLSLRSALVCCSRLTV